MGQSPPITKPQWKMARGTELDIGNISALIIGGADREMEAKLIKTHKKKTRNTERTRALAGSDGGKREWTVEVCRWEIRAAFSGSVSDSQVLSFLLGMWYFFFVCVCATVNRHWHPHAYIHQQTRTTAALSASVCVCVFLEIDWISVGSELCSLVVVRDPKPAENLAPTHTPSPTEMHKQHTCPHIHRLRHQQIKLIKAHASYPYYLDKSIHHVRMWFSVNIAFSLLDDIGAVLQRGYETNMLDGSGEGTGGPLRLS